MDTLEKKIKDILSEYAQARIEDKQVNKAYKKAISELLALISQEKKAMFKAFEESVKESSINTAKNYGQILKDKTEEQAYARGAWKAFKAFYLSPRLDSEVTQTEGESQGGVIYEEEMQTQI